MSDVKYNSVLCNFALVCPGFPRNPVFSPALERLALVSDDQFRTTAPFPGTHPEWSPLHALCIGTPTVLSVSPLLIHQCRHFSSNQSLFIF